MGLTDQDREQIQNQIALIQAAQVKPSVPVAPAQNAAQAFEKVLEEQSTPSATEEKRVKKKIRKLWGFWRRTALDSKSLEIEKIACQIEIERAETKAKLDNIKREQKVAANDHWLRLNAGNLRDIGYNTDSKPSLFWYCLKRMMFHITKLTTDVPKVIFNLFWIGLIILAITILKKVGVI